MKATMVTLFVSSMLVSSCVPGSEEGEFMTSRLRLEESIRRTNSLVFRATLLRADGVYYEGEPIDIAFSVCNMTTGPQKALVVMHPTCFFARIDGVIDSLGSIPDHRPLGSCSSDKRATLESGQCFVTVYDYGRYWFFAAGRGYAIKLRYANYAPCYDEVTNFQLNNQYALDGPILSFAVVSAEGRERVSDYWSEWLKKYRYSVLFYRL